ncbi:hypothetical protein [Armatimonas sp.]|uniref:hypothetical protein n=1 Tax=Armatimonas sp. TaxID=1872638 RepID=UPI00286D5B39|nr:hypothetical protein [Armatimonas sp.]
MMLAPARLLDLLTPRLWTPDQGAAGLIFIPPPRRLITVVGGQIASAGDRGSASRAVQRERFEATPGGLIIVSSSRKKEPGRTIGHPDLASGASVQRGDVLYVSIAEAVYRESRGETVELHFESTDEDNEALRELRVRARNRWENDRLPDGWTRPLPLPAPSPKKTGLSEELRALAEEWNARQRGPEPLETIEED